MATPVDVRLTGKVWKSGTLIDGNAIILPLEGAPLNSSVWIFPGSGDTVSYWHSPDGGDNWILRAAVTGATEDAIERNATHLKFQRTAGAGTTSKFGIT